MNQTFWSTQSSQKGHYDGVTRQPGLNLISNHCFSLVWMMLLTREDSDDLRAHWMKNLGFLLWLATDKSNAKSVRCTVSFLGKGSFSFWTERLSAKGNSDYWMAARPMNQKYSSPLKGVIYSHRWDEGGDQRMVFASLGDSSDAGQPRRCPHSPWSNTCLVILEIKFKERQ